METGVWPCLLPNWRTVQEMRRRRERHPADS